jgi:hypothetical protein
MACASRHRAARWRGTPGLGTVACLAVLASGLAACGGRGDQTEPASTPHEGRLVEAKFPNARDYVARGAGHVGDLYDGGIPPAVRTRHFLRHVLGRPN